MTDELPRRLEDFCSNAPVEAAAGGIAEGRSFWSRLCALLPLLGLGLLLNFGGHKAEALSILPAPDHRIAAPRYEPDFWNDMQRRRMSNCTAYAANDKRPNNHFPQPGQISGRQYGELSHWQVMRGAISDGFELAGVLPWNVPEPREGRTIVAIVITQDMDYHWYRLDNDGTWSHKPGSTAARNVDASGKPISALGDADWGRYKDFLGYYYIPEGGLPVGRTETPQELGGKTPVRKVWAAKPLDPHRFDHLLPAPPSPYKIS